MDDPSIAECDGALVNLAAEVFGGVPNRVITREELLAEIFLKRLIDWVPHPGAPAQ